MRTAENKSAAKTRLAQLEVEVLEKGTARLEAGKVTFRQLAEYVKTRFYVPATYSEDGSKVSGVRSVKPAHSSINKLVEYFGDRDIAKIDDEAFEKYKARHSVVSFRRQTWRPSTDITSTWLRWGSREYVNSANQNATKYATDVNQEP
jgi:hypothetical protein